MTEEREHCKLPASSRITTTTVARAFVLVALVVSAGCGGGGAAKGSNDASPRRTTTSGLTQAVEAAFRAEQQRDCSLVYSMLSTETRQALSYLRRVEGKPDHPTACEAISPHAAYEARSRWEIALATEEEGRGRVVTRVYGRECLDAGCDQTFTLILEEGEWRFDLAAGLVAAANAPRPTVTVPATPLHAAGDDGEG